MTGVVELSKNVGEFLLELELAGVLDVEQVDEGGLEVGEVLVCWVCLVDLLVLVWWVFCLFIDLWLSLWLFVVVGFLLVLVIVLSVVILLGWVILGLVLLVLRLEGLLLGFQ